MNGILYVEGTAVEATTGQMLVTFNSGGDFLRFPLPAHAALRFRYSVMKDAWQLCCTPDAEVVKLQLKRKSHAKAKQE